MGSSGFEPPTSRLSGVRSNQLSYEPIPGGDERVRTDGLLLARQALSQLSYTPVFGCDQLSRSTLQQSEDVLTPSKPYSAFDAFQRFLFFRELLFLSHIHHTGNGPRVHDFRHTFAVHTLEKQLAEGYDPMIIVPRLAAYLGHKSYRETCWYIHLTIASFPELAEKLDSAFAGIIPVVGGEIIEED